MDSHLPATGTAELLDLLSPYVPDDFINERWPSRRTGGRRRMCSSAQLFRAHLLSLLTPAHSLNLLVQMLPEQHAWRKFAQIEVPRAHPMCECCTSFDHESAFWACAPSTVTCLSRSSKTMQQALVLWL